jgi:DNA repair protein RecO (recombination protein O)
MDFKYQGIILSKKDIGETDRIYAILTLESGKIRVLAKSARRTNAKLAGSLEPVTYSEIFVAKSKGLGKITGALTINNFSKIKSDLESLEQAAYVFKILEKMVPEQEKDEKVFNLMLDYLSVLEKLNEKETNGKKEILTAGLLFKLLGELGYRIEAEKCLSCGKKLKPESNYFSPTRGGILCANCASAAKEKIKITSDSIKFIRIFLENKIANLTKLHSSKEGLRNLKAVIEEFLSWIVK